MQVASMSTRTKESEVLLEMTERLNTSISEQIQELARFGNAMISAKFIAERTVTDASSKVGESHYGKISAIMSAVKGHITSQPTQKMITKRFNDFVVKLHYLSLDILAQQLVDELRK